MAAIERLHGLPATWLGSAAVDERHDGRPVWQGQVEEFALDGHPDAKRAFAWEEPPDEEGGAPRIFAVLAVGPIKTAADAVRASIVQRAREARGF